MKCCIYWNQKHLLIMFDGLDLPGSKRFPGPYAYPGPLGAGQRHWPARTPLPAAEWLTSVSGPAGGAVPEAHVPMLTPMGSL